MGKGEEKLEMGWEGGGARVAKPPIRQAGMQGGR